MSKVIPSHVVRVGQTICVSSQGEQCLPKHGCLSSHTVPTKYFYYSTEDWDSQNSLGQAKGCSLPKSELFGSCKHSTDSLLMMMSPALEEKCLQEEPLDTADDTCPISPTLDISIEQLNRLIQEIDPTFQPLQLKQGPTQSAAQVTPHEQKRAPDSPDIKYIEMSPTRTKPNQPLQDSPSPSGAPLSGSPPNHVPRQSPGDHPDFRQHATFLGGDNSRGPQHFLHTGRHSPTFIQASESISIPQRVQRNAATGGSNSLVATSPGFENLLKPSQCGNIQQRCSEASVLSTSPGSDTSYILGSSMQSLPDNESDSLRTGSLSSVGSLSGGRGSGAYSSSVTFPRTVTSPRPPTFQKGQTPPGPLSPVAYSTFPIPILLVNGCLEQGELSAKAPKVHQGSFKQKISPPSSGVVSGIGSSSKTSSESSLTSLSSLESCPRTVQTSMKFVLDTSKYWFKPRITRDQAIQMLIDEPPGTFIIRDSTSFPGSFGLAMKVLSSKTGQDHGADPIRHFLIESSTRGVHLKGANEEPCFGSLSAFVYQHTIMPLALPCKLVIPNQDFIGGEENPALSSEAALPLPKKAAVCNLLYLRSVPVETLTGRVAVRKAVSSTFELETLPTPTVVHFKVTEQGVTLTDIQRKFFFRRYYPLATISFCDLDPENRKWQKFSRTSRIFGVIAKTPADSENICHLFAEYDPVHPASQIVDFVKRILPAA